MITRKEFNEMSFEEVWNYCCKQSDCFKDRDTLKQEILNNISLENWSISMSIMNTIDDYSAIKYWFYMACDYNLVAIRCKKDLENFIHIEEGKQKYTICFTGTQVVEVYVDSTMSKKDIEKKVLEQCCPYVESLDWITNSNTDDTLVEYADEKDI